MQEWTAGYGTPQVVNGPGCKDAGYIAMWGNKTVGEAIDQTVVFQQGQTYEITFCSRFHAGPVNYSQVQLRASTAKLTSPACGPGCEVIATTPQSSSTAWTSHSFCWTPRANYTRLTISATNGNSQNNGNFVSWADVDNICIRSLAAPAISGPATSCASPALYCVTSPVAGQTYSWNVQGGTPATATGPCVAVTWQVPSGGLVTVNTSGSGCPPEARMKVGECPHPPCCKDVPLEVGLGTPVKSSTTADAYTITPTITTPSAITVSATILATVRRSCGAAVSIDSYAPSVQPAPPAGWSGPALPMLMSRKVVWTQNGSGAQLASTPFPFALQLPPKPANCKEEVIEVCIEFEITSRDCRTCRVMRCFRIVR